MASLPFRRLWLNSVCAAMLAGCPAASPRPMKPSPAGAGTRSSRAPTPPAPTARQGPGKALDAPCKATSDCLAGLDCAVRPKGELEDAVPAGPVCRGKACELGAGGCGAGRACCPGLTGVYGPYCLPACSTQPAGHCKRLLNNKAGTCNRELGCCHVPKVLDRKP